MVVRVPDDASVLALTVTDAGPDGHQRGARNLFVHLTRPDGTVERSVQAPGGQAVILINDPPAGDWRLDVEYGGESSGDIHLAVLKRGWMDKVRKWGGWFGCKTCKIMLRALVIALLVHLGPLAVGASTGGVAAVLHALPDALLAALKQALFLGDDGLPKFVSLFLEYIGDPIDRQLTRACAWLGMC